jgi:2-keto-4-pentenoate hydratase/2-oxohepta-3-ene-1,7-dioic acid hydratase in catechol pathway
MRFVSYRSGDGWRAGVLASDVVIDAENAASRAGFPVDGPGAWRSTKALLDRPPQVLAELCAAAEACASDGKIVPGAELGPPVADPEKILCVGLNYRAHAEEFAADTPKAPDAPNLFPKFPGSLLGPTGTILLPAVAEAVDFEGELAIVIGRRCKDVPRERALECVADTWRSMT